MNKLLHYCEPGKNHATACARIVPEEQRTMDPYKVTCKGCIKWLKRFGNPLWK